MKLHLVPARTGLQWVGLGIRTFWRQPLALSALYFLYFAVMMLLAQVEFAGPLIAGAIGPAVTLGLMAANRQVERGNMPLPSVFLTAFRAGRQEARGMLVLGALYAAGSLAAIGAAYLLAGEPKAPAATEAAQLDARLGLTLLLHLPLLILFWHAPALVHWHGVQPAKSLFFSLVACIRNIGAMVVYGAAWGGLMLACALVAGTLAALLLGPQRGQAVLLPIGFLTTAMFLSSMYFTFRDSFAAEPNGETP